MLTRTPIDGGLEQSNMTTGTDRLLHLLEHTQSHSCCTKNAATHPSAVSELILKHLLYEILITTAKERAKTLQNMVYGYNSNCQNHNFR